MATSTPVVLTGLQGDWPARARWSLDDLASRFGGARVVVGHAPGARLQVSASEGVAQVEQTLSSYIHTLRGEGTQGYVISPVDERIPGLLDDIREPEAFRRARFRSVRLWLGPAGVMTPLHQDLPENLYALVFGRKRVRLISRRNRRRVYANPRLSKAPNFSPVDAWSPDLERYPRFAGVRALDCQLEAGDCLYIPRLWWHQVESLETSASLSLWFADAPVAWLAAASQRYARWRGLRS